MVVIARHDHNARRSNHLAEVLEERPCEIERLAQGAVAELDDVAEQHDLVDALELTHQDVAEAPAPQQVAVVAGGEADVGQRAARTPSRTPSAGAVGLLSVAAGILAGIMLIVRGVFEIALGWELHRLHTT